MESIRIYRKELSSLLKIIFSEVSQIASLCYKILQDGDTDSNTDRETSKLKGETHQLAVVLQYEDIIDQGFISFDAISDETERLDDLEIAVEKEEAEKLEKLICAVVDNTDSLIRSSLKNIENRLNRLSKILNDIELTHENKKETVNKCLSIINNTNLVIEELTETVVNYKGGESLSCDFPSFSFSGRPNKNFENSIPERLAKSFRVVEHKQLLNNFFPGSNKAGESGALDVF